MNPSITIRKIIGKHFVERKDIHHNCNLKNSPNNKIYGHFSDYIEFKIKKDITNIFLTINFSPRILNRFKKHNCQGVTYQQTYLMKQNTALKTGDLFYL